MILSPLKMFTSMYVCVFSYRGPTGIKGCLVVPEKKGEFRDRLRIGRDSVLLRCLVVCVRLCSVGLEECVLLEADGRLVVL